MLAMLIPLEWSTTFAVQLTKTHINCPCKRRPFMASQPLSMPYSRWLLHLLPQGVLNFAATQDARTLDTKRMATITIIVAQPT